MSEFKGIVVKFNLGDFPVIIDRYGQSFKDAYLRFFELDEEDLDKLPSGNAEEIQKKVEKDPTYARKALDLIKSKFVDGQVPGSDGNMVTIKTEDFKHVPFFIKNIIMGELSGGESLKKPSESSSTLLKQE